jgi:sugar transferase (PEP-CTERM/EpsH1 system associated)
MNVLFLSERFPYPLHDGGSLRTYHVLRGLAREHRLTLVAHRPEGDGPAGCEALADVCEIRTIDKPAVAWRVAENSFRGHVRRQGLFVLKNWSEPLLRAADQALRAHPFDVVHFNMLDTACFAAARDWPQYKIFDSHNCLSSMAGQLARRTRRRVWGAVLRRECAALLRAEAAVCGRMDATLVCSREDAEAFLQLAPEANVVVAPNGVDTCYYQPDDATPPQPGSLVFVGNMSYLPNVEAAAFFCREVLPKVRSAGKDVRVHFVGSVPAKSVRALADGRSIVVTGRVEDVRPYVQRAEVYIVPLLTGGGTRLKILEAFAMGKAVVATTKGIEGIAAADGEHFLLADSADDLAASIVRLFDDPDLRRRLGRAARRFVEQSFDWSGVQETILDAYRSLAHKGVCHAT